MKSLYKRLTNWRWEIGLLEMPQEEIVRDGMRANIIHWVKLPFKDRWFADPFILDVTETEIVLLCEEYSDKLKKGRIAKVVIDRKTYEFKSWKVLLELSTHLSFPAIIRRGETIYIYPENSESGALNLYSYNNEDDTLQPVRCIISEPLTDAIYTELFGGRQLLFSTQIPNSNTNVLDIREKNEDTQRYERIGKIEAAEKTGRMAGDFFTVDGRIYRPAQESNKEYGHAVVIQEIAEDAGRWSASEILRFTSPHPVLTLGCHTFNSYKGFVVVDVKGYRHPSAAKFVTSIARTIKKIVKH